MRGTYYALSLAAVLVMLGAAVVPASMNINLLGGAHAHDPDANDGDHNETDENETAEAVGPVIAGGGWFMVTVGNVSYKDTFGMAIYENTSIPSSFVLQGRDMSVRVHSLNFTRIAFYGNNTTANAQGWCTVNGAKGYWFNLTAMDMGKRSSDMLMLSVYKANETGAVNLSAPPTYNWLANGLGGGQISSVPEDEEMEQSDHDADDSAVHHDSQPSVVKERHRSERHPHPI